MERPKRKQMRLNNYDYSTKNYYYVTSCTANKNKLIGSVAEELNQVNIKLSNYGESVKIELECIPVHFEGVYIDKYVIMPDHLHVIIVIGCDGENERSRSFPTLATIVGLFKSGASKRIHQINPELKVWQKSYYDTIIRNEQGYLEICNYIDDNPYKWYNQM